jgi:hypothetical protein
VNEKGRVDVISCEVGYLELVVCISPIHSMFGWTTNFALPLASAKYCHLGNFTCSVLDDIRHDTVHENTCCIPLPHSTYPISSSSIYILAAFNLRINKGVLSLDLAAWKTTSITATATTEEILCYYPRLYPSESDPAFAGLLHPHLRPHLPPSLVLNCP